MFAASVAAASTERLRKAARDASLDKLLIGSILDANPGAPAGAIFEALESSESHICGKVFEDGDVVYQCKDCGFDKTCVICHDCFEESNHEGHEVTCYQTRGMGGTCDCGDAEAWAADGSCPKHGEQAASGHEDTDAYEKFPPGLKEHFESILGAAVHFVCHSAVLSVAAHNDEKLQASLPGDTQVSVVIHNDDVHTYDEVIGAFRQVGGHDQTAAFQLTQAVDDAGHSVLFKRTMQSLSSTTGTASTSVLTTLRASGLLFSLETTDVTSALDDAQSVAEWLRATSQASRAARLIIIDALTGMDVSPLMQAAMTTDLPPSTSAPPTPSAWAGTSSAAGGQQEQPSFATPMQLLLHCGPWQRQGTVEVLHALFTDGIREACFRDGFGWALLSEFPHLSRLFAQGVGTAEHTVLDYAVQILTVPSFVRRCVPREVAEAILSEAPLSGAVATRGPLVPLAGVLGDVLAHACTLSLKALYAPSTFQKADQARQRASISAEELGPEGSPQRFGANVLSRALDSSDRVLVYNRHQVTGRILDYVSRIPGVAAVTLAQPGMWDAVLRAAAAVSDSGPHWHKTGDHVGHDGQLWVQEFNASIPCSSLLSGVLYDAVVPAAHAYAERLDVARGVTPPPPQPTTVDSMLTQGAWGTAGLSVQQWRGVFRSVLEAHARRRACLLPTPPAAVTAAVQAGSEEHIAMSIAPLGVGQPPFSMPVDTGASIQGTMPLTAQNSASSFHGLLPRLGGLLAHALSTRLPGILPRSPFAASIKVHESGDADGVASALGAAVLDAPSLVAKAAEEVAATLSSGEHSTSGAAITNMLMDGPLNTLAMAGAVRAGLWKRNGHAVETELMNYAEPPHCFTMQDADLQTVALAVAARVAAVAPGDLPATQSSLDSCVARLLKAFDVWSTLLHPAARLAIAAPGVMLPRPNVYLLEAALARAEEALRLLVQLTTELPYRAAPPVSDRAPISVQAFAEASSRRSVQREVVHFLMRGPAARSAIARCLAMYKTRGAGRVDDDVLTQTLREVADFREGAGMDAGKYALKKDVMQCMYDPCFMHLSPESHTLAKDAWREVREGSLDGKFAKVPFAAAAVKSKYIKAALTAARPMVPIPAVPAPGYIRALSVLFAPSLLRVVQVVLHAAVSSAAQSTAVDAVRKATQAASGWKDTALPHSDAPKVLFSQSLLQLALQLLTNALHVAELWRAGHAGLHAAAGAHMPQFGALVEWWLLAAGSAETPACVCTTVPEMGLPLPPDKMFARAATAVAVFAEASGQLLGEYNQRPSNAQMVAWVLHAGTGSPPTALQSPDWDARFFACFTSSPAVLKAAAQRDGEDKDALQAAHDHVVSPMRSVVSLLGTMWRGEADGVTSAGAGAADSSLAEPSPLVRESAAWCLSSLQQHAACKEAVDAATGMAAALAAEAASAADDAAEGSSTPGDKKAKSAKKAKKGKKGKDAQLKAMQRLKSQQASFLGELSGDESEDSEGGGAGLASALLPTLAEPSETTQTMLCTAGVDVSGDDSHATAEFHADSVPRGALDNTSAVAARDDAELAVQLHNECLLPLEQGEDDVPAARRPLVSLALASAWRRRRVQRLASVGRLASLLAEDGDLTQLAAADAVPAGHIALPRLEEVQHALGKPEQVLAACGLAPDGSVLSTMEHGAVCILCRDTELQDPLLFLSLLTPPGLFFPSLLRTGGGVMQDVATSLRALLGPQIHVPRQLVPPAGTHYAISRGLALAARGEDTADTWLHLLNEESAATASDGGAAGEAARNWTRSAQQWLAAHHFVADSLLGMSAGASGADALSGAAAQRSMLLGTIMPPDASSKHMQLLCPAQSSSPAIRPSAAEVDDASGDELDAALDETLGAAAAGGVAAAGSQGTAQGSESDGGSSSNDESDSDSSAEGGAPSGPPEGVSMALWGVLQQIVGSGNPQISAMLQGLPTPMVAQMLASSGALPVGISTEELMLGLQAMLAQAAAGGGDAADNVMGEGDSDEDDDAAVGLEMNISQADRRARASKAVRNALTADRLVAWASLGARGGLSQRAGGAGGAHGSMRVSFTGTCMHSSCAQKFLEKGHESSFARNQAANIMQSEAGEFQCPLSRELCNSMLPRSFGASNGSTVCPPDAWWAVQTTCDNEAIRAALVWERSVLGPALLVAAEAAGSPDGVGLQTMQQLHSAIAACDQPFALLGSGDFKAAVRALVGSLVAALGAKVATDALSLLSLDALAAGSMRLPRHVRLLAALKTALSSHEGPADGALAPLPPADILGEVEAVVLSYSFTVATQGSHASIAQTALRIRASSDRLQQLLQGTEHTLDSVRNAPLEQMPAPLQEAVAELRSMEQWSTLLREGDAQAAAELNAARGFVVSSVDAMENAAMLQQRRKRHWAAAVLLAKHCALPDQPPSQTVVLPVAPSTAQTSTDVAGVKRPRQDSAQELSPLTTPVVVHSFQGHYMGLVPPQVMGTPSTPREDAPMFIRAPLHQVARLTQLLRVLAVAVQDSLVFTTALPAPFTMLKEAYDAEASAAAAGDLDSLLQAPDAAGAVASAGTAPLHVPLSSRSSAASVSVATSMQTGTFSQAGDVPLSPQPAAGAAGRTQSAWASLLTTARRLVSMECRSDGAVLVAPVEALLAGAPAVRVGPTLQTWASALASCGLSKADMQLTTQGAAIHPWLVGVPSAFRAPAHATASLPAGIAPALLVLPLELVKFLAPHQCNDEAHWSYDEGCTLRAEGPLAAGMPLRLVDLHPSRVLLLLAAVSTRWEDLCAAAAQLLVLAAVQGTLQRPDGAAACTCSALEFYQFASALLRAVAPVDVRAGAAAAVLRGSVDVTERSICPQLLAVHEALHGAGSDQGSSYVAAWGAAYLGAALRDVWVGAPAAQADAAPAMKLWRGVATVSNLQALLHRAACLSADSSVPLGSILQCPDTGADSSIAVAQEHVLALLQHAVAQQPASGVLTSASTPAAAVPAASGAGDVLASAAAASGALPLYRSLPLFVASLVPLPTKFSTLAKHVARGYSALLPKHTASLRASAELTSVQRVFGLSRAAVGSDTHLAYEEPAVDLVTGTIVPAAQQTRAPGDGRGLVARFTEAVHGGVGVFLLARTSAILLVRQDFMAYFPSPYVDKHGEPDVGLRRGLPLVLAPERYAKLCKAWASGELATLVTRARTNADRVIRVAWY